MKNTVKLEQFKEVTEAELQEIRGGDKRHLTFLNIFFQIGQSSNYRVIG